MKVSESTVYHLWDSEKNTLSPDEITTGSHKLAWWICVKGHSHVLPIAAKIRRPDGCSICSGREVLVGFNDLTTTHPEIVALWDFKLNKKVPANVTVGKNEKFYWVCEQGHSWFSTPANIARGRRCPYCSGQKILTNFNDLASQVPDSKKFWDYEKNSDRPEKINKGSHKTFFWVCEKNHTWETTAEKFTNGSRCPYCARRKTTPETSLTTLYPEIATEWSKQNDKLAHEITSGSEYYASWVCSTCNKTWKNYVFNRTRKTGGSGCPHCAAGKQTSKGELELANFVQSISKTPIETSARNIIKGELDIYIPEKKIAIEFNGIYWHSEAAGKTKTYHYDKWLQCKNQGIQLIQIWEDDWNRNSELVKQMIAHKIGATIQKKIYARQTKIRILTQPEIGVFLNKNHIQGKSSGSIKLGLVDQNNEIVAAMLLKRDYQVNKGFILVRYATSRTVVGGFTKLLKHIENMYDVKQIMTFSDNTVSDGGLYKNNGFVSTKTIPPDYMYVVGNERTHKFGYRLKRFQNDPNLKYISGLTERELAFLNKIPRVWDAGKTRWVKSYK